MNNYTPSPEHVRLLRSLKKTAAVLLTMLILNHPTGEAEIAEVLDINRGTARQHLKSLEKAGLIMYTHQRFNGWVLSKGWQQLILPAPSLALSDGDSFPEKAMVEIPPSFPSSTTTFNKKEYHSAAEEETTMVEKPPSPVLAALHAQGIGEPSASQLAALPWATPNYVRAAAQELHDQGRFATGLLVHKIRQHDQVECAEPEPSPARVSEQPQFYNGTPIKGFDPKTGKPIYDYDAIRAQVDQMWDPVNKKWRDDEWSNLKSI